MASLQAQIASLAADDPTRAILMSWHDRVEAGQYAPSHIEINLALNVNGKEYTVFCRDDEASILLIHSILIRKEYCVPAETATIYDLGANIGIASIYFHSILPEVEITCVEPGKENLELLRRNLEINKIRATVIEGVVSKSSGVLPLYLYPDAALSHSLYNKQRAMGSSRYIVDYVRSFRFDEVIQGKGYGIKIDIEGSEHDLAEFPDVINNAAWIIGEAHYGSFLGDGNVDLLENIPRDRFALEVVKPTHVDDRINRQFKAVRHGGVHQAGTAH